MSPLTGHDRLGIYGILTAAETHPFDPPLITVGCACVPVLNSVYHAYRSY
jgi:hypothetical protein